MAIWEAKQKERRDPKFHQYESAAGEGSLIKEWSTTESSGCWVLIFKMFHIRVYSSLFLSTTVTIFNSLLIPLSLFSLVASLALGASRGNLFTLWVAIEVNMLAFVGLMASSFSTPISVFKYFLVQRSGSALFLLVILWRQNQQSTTTIFVASLALAVKLGIAPAHYWLIGVMGARSWGILFILASIQKILPLLAWVVLGVNNDLIIMTGIIFRVLGSLGQIRLKGLLAYSSVFGIRWVLASIGRPEIWLIFLGVYVWSAILFSAIAQGDEREFLWGGRIGGSSIFLKLRAIFGSLSMAGFPPTPGFTVKVWILLERRLEFSSVLNFGLVLSSIFFLSLYIQFRLNLFTNERGGIGGLNPRFGSSICFRVLMLFTSLMLWCLRLGVTHEKFWVSRTSEYYRARRKIIILAERASSKCKGLAGLNRLGPPIARAIIGRSREEEGIQERS